MFKRLTALIALCLLLYLPCLAFATESEEGFVEPTRDPNAPTYDAEHPEDLVPEQIVARGFVLMETSTGEILLSRDEDVQMYPASTTKIMTALIALQIGDLDDIVEVSERAVDIPDDSSKVPFKAGEKVTLRDALYGMLLRSGNDAANAIAEYVSGDIGLFVEEMNKMAAVLGCENTHFSNAHGYHDDYHQTTPKELAIIMRTALQNETFREIIGTYTYNLSASNLNPARQITNSNLHIDPTNEDRFIAYSIGGKTGFHSLAGYVLVEAAEQNGVELIAVAMYSSKYARWPDTSRLFQYGFTFYDSVTAEEIYALNQTTVQISGFSETDPDLGKLALNIQAVDSSRQVRFVDKKAEIERLIENYTNYTYINWERELRAPIAQGEVLGTLTFFPPNGEPAEYELIASRAVQARANMPPTLEEIEQSVRDDPSPFPPFSWDWVLPPVLGAAGIGLVIRAVVKKLLARRKRRKKIPKPKRRVYT